MIFIDSINELCYTKGTIRLWFIRKGINMGTILYCRIGTMNYYQGLNNDSISGGERYLRENKIGGEIYNFQFINGNYYGFVEPGHQKGAECRIHVEKLGGSLKVGIAHGILVVWVSNGKLVGWYNNADVYSIKQRVPDTVMVSRDHKEACEFNIRNDGDWEVDFITEQILDEKKKLFDFVFG